jgi:MFS family permease
MSTIPATFRAVSARGPLRRALGSYQLYGIVEMTVWVGMVLYAFDEGGAPLAGLVAVVELVPAALVSPIIVSRIDHLSRGTTLLLSQAAVALCSLLTLLALLAQAPVAVVVAAATITLTAVAVVRPLYFAALPQLADGPAALVSANSLSSVTEGVSYFLGPVLAGVATQISGTWLVFLCSTVLAGVAALLCLRLGLRAAGPRADGTDVSWLDAIRNLGSLWGEWGVLALLLVMATRFMIGGALDILGISYSVEVLGNGAAGAGLLIGAIGVGGLLGALLAGPLSMRRRLGPVVGAAGVVQGLGLAVVAVLTLLFPAMLALVVCGIGGAVIIVAGRTLLQRTTDDQVLARVFAVQEGVALLGWAFGSAIAPVVIELMTPASAFVPFGVGCALFTVASLLFIRRLDARAVLHPAEMELLRRVPFLSVLPPYELERLASHATWVAATPGEAIVRQGDAGTAFYVIAEGEFTVTIDGVERAGRLGPGTGFGEIALLHAVPRTATVTASTDGRLLSLDSEKFLAAVTDSVDGRTLAVEVTDAHLRRDTGVEG